MGRLAKSLFALLCAASMACAHEGVPLEPHDLLTRDAWRFDPLVVAGLALSAWLYYAGSRLERGMRKWEVGSFWAGWAALFVALLSPLHPMGEALFSAHMVQHELMMVVAAPLLVLGRPLVPFLWGMPFQARRRAGRWARSRWISRPWLFLTLPLNAFFLHMVVLWAWHLPVLFQATLTSDVVHSAQHISFLVSALLFWWALIRGHGARRQFGAGVLYLFATMMHTGLLGVLLTFSPTAWYVEYGGTAEAWGLTPLEDQQLAGLIMWVPPAVVYLAASLVLVALWLRECEPCIER